jgi:chorismate mutase
MNLENVRKELIEIENQLIALLEKRVNLGVQVAEAKYPNIKNLIKENNILELIEDKNVENSVLDRVRQKCDDPRLRLNMIRLYQDYLIPKNKEIQVQYLREKHFNNN